MLGQKYYTPEEGWIRKDVVNNAGEFTITGGSFYNTGFNGPNSGHPCAYGFNKIEMTLPVGDYALRVIGLCMAGCKVYVYTEDKNIGAWGILNEIVPSRKINTNYLSCFETQISLTSPTVLRFEASKAAGWNTQLHAVDYKAIKLPKLERFLLQDGVGYKTITETGLQALDDFVWTTDYFGANGFTDVSSISNVISELGSQFDILRYNPDDANNAIQINHLLAPQLITMTTGIDLSAYKIIDSISLVTEGAAGTVKLALSFDKGATWQTYFDSWQRIACTNETLATDGMTAVTLNNIPPEQWTAASTGSLRIAFYLAKAVVTDDIAIASLSITGDTAAWMLASDDDYTYSYLGTRTMQIKLLADGSYKINYTEQK